MNQSLMLWPVMAQILLVMFLYLHLAVVKAREIKAGNVSRASIAVDQEKWPDSVRLVNNNLRNQFETPILFYTLCFALMGLGEVTKATFGVACAYALFRCMHAFIHVTSNNLRLRTPVFIAGFLMLQVLLVFAVSALLKVS